MKKLLFTLVTGAFMALGANAQATLYMTGNLSESNWNPGSPIELQPNNSTYTYQFEPNTAPQFKISTTKGTSQGDWNGFNAGVIGYNSNNGTIPINSEVELVAGRSGNSETPTAANYTLNIRYSNGNYYMTVSTDDGKTPEVIVPETIYVRGDINSWGGADSPLTRQGEADSNGIYTFTGRLPILYGEFKIAQDLSGAWSGINYGSGDTRSPIIGQRVECWSGGQNFICSGTFTDITLTFYYDPNTNNPSYLYAESASGPSYPETLYIYGYANGNDFTPNKGVECNSANDGVYQFNNVVIGTAYDNDYGYFHFTPQLSDNTNDWPASSIRYGATEEDLEVVAGETYNIQNGDLSWKILPGTYNFTVNLTTNKLDIIAISSSETTPPALTIPSVLYILGNLAESNGQWDLSKTVALETSGNGVFTATGVTLLDAGGSAYFSFINTNSTDWDEVEDGNHRYGPATDGEAVTAGTSFKLALTEKNAWTITAGTYDIEVDFNNATVVMTVSEQTYDPGVGETPSALYVLGNLENNNWTSTVAMKSTEEGVFTVEDVVLVDAGEGYAYLTFINIADVDWDIVNDGTHRYGPLASGTELEKNVETDFYIGGDSSWKILPETYNITVNFNTGKVLASVSSSIKSIEESLNGEDMIFNLQGQKIGRNNLQKGIYIINGKKVLVK